MLTLSKIGRTVRQGLHQLAQKSSTTTLPLKDDREKIPSESFSNWNWGASFPCRALGPVVCNLGTGLGAREER